MKLISLVIFLLCGCVVTKEPTIVEPEDTSYCSSACIKLRDLGCEEGKPLDDGTSCEKFCEHTQEMGHKLEPECISKYVDSCMDLDNLDSICKSLN